MLLDSWQVGRPEMVIFEKARGMEGNYSYRLILNFPLVNFSPNKENQLWWVLGIRKPISTAAQRSVFFTLSKIDQGRSFWSEGWIVDEKKETTSSVCRLKYHCLNKSNTDCVAVELLEEVERAWQLVDPCAGSRQSEAPHPLPFLGMCILLPFPAPRRCPKDTALR